MQSGNYPWPRHEEVASAILASAVGFLDRVLGRTPERDRAPELDQARTFTLDACVVHAGGLLGIVGESYRQEKLRALSARTTDAAEFREELVDYAAEVADSEPERRWFRAVLVREPDNPKDGNAIAVYAQAGGKVGYLRREDARRYGQVFESLEKRGYAAAACPAMLMGGGAGESYGVVLAISAPGYVLHDLTAEEREAACQSKARQKDARDRSVYETALADETWEAIAEAHGYKSVGELERQPTVTRSGTASSRLPISPDLDPVRKTSAEHLAQVDRATVGLNREMCSFLSCLSPSTNCDIASPSPAPSGRSKNPSPASCGDGTGIAFAIDRELKKIVKRRRFRNPSGASPPYSSTQTTSREEWT